MEKTALMIACIEHNYNVVNVLIMSGSNVNIQDRKGKTALIFACKKHDYDIVNVLVKNKANINLEDTYGNNALSYASRKNNNKIYRYLIGCINANNTKENNSIIYMLKDKNDKTIKTLKLIETFPENVISSNKSEDSKVQAVKKFISACQKMDFNTILTLVSRGNFVFKNKFDIVNDIYIYIKYLETRGYSLYNW